MCFEVFLEVLVLSRVATMIPTPTVSTLTGSGTYRTVQY